MTNIPQVDIWAEAEAFFDSITNADIALRIVAATEVAACGREMLGQSCGQCGSAAATKLELDG